MILKTIDLEKSYFGQFEKVNAINHVNLEIKNGDFIGLFGVSGSGKSTLLYLLSSLIYPSSGKVLYNGIDIYSLNNDQRNKLKRKSFGFVFQFFHLIPTLTVEENIILPVLIDKNKPDMNYINELLFFLGLEGKNKHMSSKLSGGQQQRVAIARALANKPAVIFADEPTGNLDSKTSLEVFELLKNTSEQYNQTMVIASHDQNIISNCNRMITLRDGQIVSDIFREQL